MKIKGQTMNLSRVEIITRVFDVKGFCKEEQIEYWYPEEKKQSEMGFKLKT